MCIPNEVTLTTYGGNGEGHRIVYSTAHQIYDYVIEVFNGVEISEHLYIRGWCQAKMKNHWKCMIQRIRDRNDPNLPLLGSGK